MADQADRLCAAQRAAGGGAEAVQRAEAIGAARAGPLRGTHNRHWRGTRATASPPNRVMNQLKLLLAAGLAAPLLATAAPGAVVTTPQVRAELVAHAPEGIAAGRPLSLGLKIEHKPHWHTYWKNPGDSGLPTTLAWTLPAGLQAGDIEWPTPSKLPIGPLMNYGFEGTLLLPVTVTVPADFTADALEVRLRAEWLVCKDVCIPEEGEFALSLPTQAATAGDAALFAAARASLPQDVAGARATAAIEDGSLVVTIAGLPPDWQGRALTFYPETPGVIQNAAKPPDRWQGGEWSARVPLDPQRSDSPTTMPVVLAAEGQPAGLRVQVAVTTPWPAIGAGPAPTVAEVLAPVPPAAPAAPTVGLALALLLALAGGALLNLMPCVFPVLSLKVLGFAAHGSDRRTLLHGGLAYTVGVVLSFVALAALLLVLRAGGEQLGWGFQLQSPAVVATLAALFTLIGLNLAGVFELGSVLPGSVATVRARHPLVDSLLTGVLAVAVASPCTAPFMGASLGLAVTLPAWQALAVFAALGLGMALPYLAASAWPALARLLPRPGRVDAALQDRDGVPDVCHRDLAGLGAGAADGHRRRRGAARLVAGAELCSLGARLADAGRACPRRLRRRGAGAGGGGTVLGRAGASPRGGGASAGCRRSLATVVGRARGAGAGRRAAGLRGLHRRVVRDLPVQQAHHARATRGA